MSARAAILERVRANLAQARGELPHTSAAPPERGSSGATRPGPPLPGEGLPERFRAQLEGVGGHVHVVRSLDEAGRRLAEIAAGVGATRIALSDAARVIQVTRGLPAAIERIPADAGKEALLGANLGVSTAQWGIAETGTLVLESARERHRLVSLLPDVHVALLSSASILATLEDALAAVRAGSGLSSKAVTWITGPSRTADIELVLVVGVHGPKELHVLLSEE